MAISHEFHNSCKCMVTDKNYLSSYNVLFSTLKRLLTMIQQLYIHPATDSDNTHKQFYFCAFMRVTLFCVLLVCPVLVCSVPICVADPMYHISGNIDSDLI